jgi:hypothetical protein
MSDKMIEQTKADRDAGTPGPWTDDKKTHDQPYLSIKIGKKFHTVCTIWIDDAPVEDFNSEQEVNARRIARVPDMESRILADAEVIKAAEELADNYESLIMNVARLQEFNLDQDLDALTDFRQAQQARAALEEKNDD